MRRGNAAAISEKPSENTIFIVEDEPLYRRVVEYTMRLNPEHKVLTFETGRDCLKNLHLNPRLVVLDYGLPDMLGIEVLRKIKSVNSGIEVIMLSGQKDISVAVSLLKEGAYDYINKEDQTSMALRERLLNVVHHIKKNQELQKEVHILRDELSNKYEFSKTIKGQSPAIQKVFQLLQKSVKTDITVSITGETGTGKEVAAKAIHYNSKRRKGPFVAVNIAAIPRDLLESELFGHERGAFTGAVTRRIGKFEQADGGTLFLDEIGEMDINLQAKLLRVLQERELHRIGSNQTVKINTRIIVATHRNLQELVQNGDFRQDLYYRLLGLPIEMPPLRERGKDILLLAMYFLTAFCKSNQLPKMEITPKAKEKLLQYNYPGNVRELKAVVELAAVMTNGEIIEPEHLSFNNSLTISNLLNEEITLKEYNKRIVCYYLEKYNNNVLLVAEKLGIGKSTIYRMIKEIQ